MSNKRKRSTTDQSSNSVLSSLLLSECKVLLVNQSKDSFVWMYFGELVMKNNENKVQPFLDKYVCNRCFEVESQKSTELTLLKSCNIKSYAKSVSTGNLSSHLLAHGIKQHKPFEATKRTLDSFFNTVRDVRTITNTKFMLIRDLVLLCCKDLFPFNLVSGEGLRDFFMKYKIIVSDNDMPCRTSIGRALNEVYQDCKSYVTNRIKNECPDVASMTFDMWSDKHRRRSYITFTLHYIDKDFRLINLTLATIHFPERHTGVNIHSEMEKMIFEFGLERKTLYMVTDAGSNCRLACEIGNFDNLLCLGHGLHNAITTDGFEKSPGILKLITKVKQIVKALRYRTSRFEKLSKDQHALAVEMSKLSEDLLIFDNEKELDDLESTHSGPPKTLKLDVSTRWHSQLTMIESLTCQNKNVINVMLEGIGKGDLVLSQNDYSLLNELCQFLKHFKKITELLSGDRYPTTNYVVIFRSEVRALLDVEPQDSIEIKRLKHNILNNFDHRFPLLEIHIVSALLDPRFQNLHDVKEYLKCNNISAVDLLMKWIAKIGASESYETTRHNDQVESQSYIEELVERHSTLASLRESTSVSRKSQCERECHFLLSMGGKIEIENILIFWRNQLESMPKVANLAAKLFCIPATSTPSERNFSIAGIIIDSKRSRLSPDNLDYILFIHNNYGFIREVRFSKGVNDTLVSNNI